MPKSMSLDTSRTYSDTQIVWFSAIWSALFVGIPTVAYVLSGGLLTPGWALFPAIAGVVLFCFLLVLSTGAAKHAVELKKWSKREPENED